MKRITKTMLCAVEGIIPSTTLIKVKDSKLRFISKILIDHRLVVRKANERSIYIPENHYHLIYDAISDLSEYKLSVNKDLNFMMICAIEDWLLENKVVYNEILIDSKIAKTGHLLNKVKGASKIKQVKINGKIAKFRFVDSRLVKYIFSNFKDHPEFQKRFVK
ncbi:hypothetical protein LCA30_02160 [Vibrio harveyi]|uniref:hypothetical protein n=1 Tax=Vibrio harveyi TaxID=669 RepID=UPI003BB643AD